MAGYRKAVENYELRTVNNAGHLVPMDQGEAARQMLNEFVAKTKNWKGNLEQQKVEEVKRQIAQEV